MAINLCQKAIRTTSFISCRAFSTGPKYGDFTTDTQATYENSSAATPVDQDYMPADAVSNEQHNLIMGLSEFEQSVKFFHEKRYGESEHYLKDALKILKSAKQDQSLGYLFLLKRLAYVCFMSRKYTEAEKYFRINAEMVPTVTKNPVNIFNAQKNLLLLHTYTDIEKASNFGQRMLADSEDFLPVHNKDLCFMLGNISFLKGDHIQAKNFYRNVLRNAPQQQLESQILNNLAFCSWIHVLDIPKLKKDQSQDDSQIATILSEEKYTMSYLLQSIEINEKAQNPTVNLTLLQRLMELDLNAEGVKLSTDEEEDLFGLLTAEGQGKAVTNLSEYLLMTQAMKGEIKNAYFWFRLGLKYFERANHKDIERHLIMLGLFYATRDKKMMAEGLYRRVLDNLDHDKSCMSVNYNLVMALNFYGRMLLANPKREREANDYLKQSEALAQSLPFWYDKIDNIHMPDFDLD